MRKINDSKKAIRLNATDRKILMLYSNLVIDNNVEKEEKDIQKKSGIE